MQCTSQPVHKRCNPLIVQGSFDKSSGVYTTKQLSLANLDFAIDNVAPVAFSTANLAYSKANSANILAQAGFNAANTAQADASGGFAKANTANTTAEAAFSP